jgi:hypothetical protein
VGADVVEDDVDLEAGRNGRLDPVEERAELDRPVAPVALADHLALRHVRMRPLRQQLELVQLGPRTPR